MTSQPDDDIGTYSTFIIEQNPNTGRPLLRITVSEVSDDLKSRSYDYENVQNATITGVLLGWTKAVDAFADMFQHCRADAVSLMERAGRRRGCRRASRRLNSSAAIAHTQNHNKAAAHSRPLLSPNMASATPFAYCPEQVAPMRTQVATLSVTDSPLLVPASRAGYRRCET